MIYNFNLLILFIFILIFIFTSYNLFYLKKEFFNLKYKNIDLVISRYNEDLSFLLNDEFNNYRDEFNFIIYNKGPKIENKELNNLCLIIDLPNVGRECHTNLYHIINHYDELAEVTIFLPGSFYNMQHKKPRSMKTLELVKEKKNSIFLVEKSDKPIYDHFADFVMEKYESSSNENKQIMNKSQHDIKLSPERPFKNWFNKNFPNNNTNIYFYNSIFAVSNNDILKNDKKFYQKLFNYLNEHSNPEVGHYIERSWCAIFKPSQDSIIFEKQF